MLSGPLHVARLLFQCESDVLRNASVLGVVNEYHFFSWISYFLKGLFLELISALSITNHTIVVMPQGLFAHYIPIVFFNFIPINHMPPRLNIIRTAIFILKIIGMLPDIKAHNRL